MREKMWNSLQTRSRSRTHTHTQWVQWMSSNCSRSENQYRKNKAKNNTHMNTKSTRNRNHCINAPDTKTKSINSIEHGCSITLAGAPMLPPNEWKTQRTESLGHLTYVNALATKAWTWLRVFRVAGSTVTSATSAATAAKLFACNVNRTSRIGRGALVPANVMCVATRYCGRCVLLREIELFSFASTSSSSSSRWCSTFMDGMPWAA